MVNNAMENSQHEQMKKWFVLSYSPWMVLGLTLKNLRCLTCFFPLDQDPGDFPGGPVVESLPCNAGDVGLILGQGTRVPHAVGQLSPCTAITEEKPMY